ncbi:MAG: hypothetical protein P4L53_23555 [Candidatus Obscuribacterales bacterium]|nr:hypothetical protein [Candidatus Obscuribacterales bacterium]
MGPFDAPKIAENIPSSSSAEIQKMQASNGMLDEIFALKDKTAKTQKGPEISDLGRIAQMSMPVGWTAGNDVNRGTSYAKEFHPKTQNAAGEAVENKDVQMVFSYRGNRLSDDASKAFRELIDSPSKSTDGKGQPVTVLDLQRTPLNEVLGERGSAAVFTPAFAEIQKINGEPALVVVGKYAKYDVKAKLIYIDADRNNRTAYGAPVQEIAFMAPSDQFYKYSTQANKALNSVEWQH